MYVYICGNHVCVCMYLNYEMGICSLLYISQIQQNYCKINEFSKNANMYQHFKYIHVQGPEFIFWRSGPVKLGWLKTYILVPNHTLLKGQLWNLWAQHRAVTSKKRELEKRQRENVWSLEIVMTDLAHHKRSKRGQSLQWGGLKCLLTECTKPQEILGTGCTE